jgi:hypothetical protein
MAKSKKPTKKGMPFAKKGASMTRSQMMKKAKMPGC